MTRTYSGQIFNELQTGFGKLNFPVTPQHLGNGADDVKSGSRLPVDRRQVCRSGLDYVLSQYS